MAEAGNLAKAAQGDATKQSQYSRQNKELEAYFGVPLTRRVGRRIEITPEGNQLASIIRRQFGEIDDFRESMAGRSLNVRFTGQRHRLVAGAAIGGDPNGARERDGGA